MRILGLNVKKYNKKIFIHHATFSFLHQNQKVVMDCLHAFR